jgi:hypothetical protein
MDMQDNEFDGLFRDKLNGFESEPSEKVWPRIDGELDKKKIALLPWLSVAASIVVLVSAGILFIPKGHKDDHTGNNVAKNHTAPVTVKQTEQVAVSTAPVEKDEPAKQEQKINTKRYEKMAVAPSAPVKTDETIVKNEPVKLAEQPAVIASVVPPKTEPVKQGAVPGSGTPLIAEQNVNADSAMNAKPMLIAKAQPQVKPETPAVKKHGIRNFGELVNLVVARVDKRKDKAVKFTDEDDGDGSTLTAVNIGPVKIGKEEK